MSGVARGLRQRIRLNVLRVSGGLYSMPRAEISPRSILLIRPDHLGDLLLLTPALRALREALPRAQLTLLIGPWSAAALRGNPDVDAVETLPFPGFERRARSGPFAPYRLLFDTARRLRGRFDTAVVFRYDHWWGAWLAAAAGIPYRLGYAWPETQPFLTKPVPYKSGRHEALQNAYLLESLAPGIAKTLGRARYSVAAADRRWAVERLLAWESDLGVSDPLRIAIHPGAGAAVKQWPVENWAQVGNAVSSATGAELILTGGRSELDLAQGISARLSVPHLDLAGQTSFGQLAAVYSQCDLVLGSDSGPLHLAVATGAKTLHLYGPVPAAKFGPWGDPQRNLVLSSPFSCAPCDRLDWPLSALRLHGCIAAIRSSEVIDAALRLIRSEL